PASCTEPSWKSISAPSTPRRRWVGSTPTQLTPAAGTVPPGTVTSREYAAAMPTSRSSSYAPMSRPGSWVSRADSSSSGGAVMPNAWASTSRNARQSSSPSVRTGQVLRGEVIRPAYQTGRTPGQRNASVNRTWPHALIGRNASVNRTWPRGQLGTVCAMPAVRPSRRRGRQASWWRAKTWVRRHVLHSDGFALLALSACAAASGALFLTNRSWFPLSTLALVVLAGGFLLTVRSLL